MKNLITLLLISITLITCKENTDFFESKTIEISLIGKGNLFGNGLENLPQQNTVITNNEDWLQLKTQLDTLNNVTSNFTETEIDFENYQIIASLDHIKPNGGHSLEMTIIENQDSINVTVFNLAPQGNVTLVITPTLYYCKNTNK